MEGRRRGGGYRNRGQNHVHAVVASCLFIVPRPAHDDDLYKDITIMRSACVRLTCIIFTPLYARGVRERIKNIKRKNTIFVKTNKTASRIHRYMVLYHGSRRSRDCGCGDGGGQNKVGDGERIL